MAWTERRGRRYRGMYRDASGVARSAGWSTSKKEAAGWAQEEEAKIRRGTWHDPDAGKVSFSTYFEDHWLPNRVAEANTLAGYASHYRSSLKDEFGDLELRKITAPVIQRWIIKLEKAGVKPRTIHAKYRTLATVLGGRKGVSAVRDGLIPTSPCEGVTLPPVDTRAISIYSVPEADRLMSALGEWWQPIPVLGADSALRWGELMGLEVADFSDDYRRIVVSRTLVEITKEATGNGTPFMVKYRPKSGKPREVWISAEVATLVEAVVKSRQLFPRDRLFSMPGADGLPARTDVWTTGQPISRSYFREYVWKPAHVATGIEPRRFHDLRGSHISWLLAGGADVVTVMQRVGHTNLATTQLYVDAMADAGQRALDALEATRKHQRNA